VSHHGRAKLSDFFSRACAFPPQFTLLQPQVMPYGEEDVPEAKFLYDVSPMAVVVQKKGRHLYDYITSLLAILGGTFTVVSLMDNTLYVLFKAKAD